MSDLVRLLLQLPADDVAAECAVALAQARRLPRLGTPGAGPLASSVRSIAESRILFL